MLIVETRQRGLHRALREALAGTAFEVLYERRVGQRRRTAAGPAAAERRRIDRRRSRATAFVYEAPVRPKAPSATRGRHASRVTAMRSPRPRRRQPASV
jgi:hypothetical protein